MPYEATDDVVTDDELVKLLTSLGDARKADGKLGFTEDEAEAVYSWARETRVANTCLEMVLKGNLSIDVNGDGQVLLKRGERPPAAIPSALEPPTLDAYESRRGWEIWCVYCRAWHQHSSGEGHRVAHCHRESAYRRVGYILRLAGPMTDAIRRSPIPSGDDHA